MEHLTCKVYGLLEPFVIYPNKYIVDHLQGCDKVEVQLLSDLELRK